MFDSYSRLSCGGSGSSFVRLVTQKPRRINSRKHRLCKQCNSLFLETSQRKSFCSLQCAGKSKRTKPILVCNYCAKTYVPKAIERNRYCSRECYFQGKHEKVLEHNLPQSAVYFIVCEICNKTWTARQKNSRTCSAACSKAAADREELARNLAKHKRDGRVTSCDECGCKFCPLYGSSTAILCFPCAESRKRAARAARAAIRRALDRVNKVDPFKVFDRDGWVCRSCGTPTPKTKRGTYANNAPELDHVKPLALGGLHTYENTQCLCRRCNSEKSDKWHNEEESRLQVQSHSR